VVCSQTRRSCAVRSRSQLLLRHDEPPASAPVDEVLRRGMVERAAALGRGRGTVTRWEGKSGWDPRDRGVPDVEA
jgi:hypothetical protein